MFPLSLFFSPVIITGSTMNHHNFSIKICSYLSFIAFYRDFRICKRKQPAHLVLLGRTARMELQIPSNAKLVTYVRRAHQARYRKYSVLPFQAFNLQD